MTALCGFGDDGTGMYDEEIGSFLSSLGSVVKSAALAPVNMFRPQAAPAAPVAAPVAPTYTTPVTQWTPTPAAPVSQPGQGWGGRRGGHHRRHPWNQQAQQQAAQQQAAAAAQPAAPAYDPSNPTWVDSGPGSGFVDASGNIVQPYLPPSAGYIDPSGGSHFVMGNEDEDTVGFSFSDLLNPVTMVKDVAHVAAPAVKAAINPMTAVRAIGNVIKNPFNPLAQTQATLNLFRNPASTVPATPTPGTTYYPTGYSPYYPPSSTAIQPSTYYPPGTPYYPPAPTPYYPPPPAPYYPPQPLPVSTYYEPPAQQAAASYGAPADGYDAYGNPIYDMSQLYGDMSDTGWQAAYGSGT